MYVRSKKIGNNYYNYLVESVRTGKKVVQKYIRYLGKTVNAPTFNREYKVTISESGNEVLNIVNSDKSLTPLFMRDGTKRLIQQLQRDFVDACIENGYSIAYVKGASEKMFEDYMRALEDLDEENRIYYEWMDYTGSGYEITNSRLRKTPEFDEWKNKIMREFESTAKGDKDKIKELFETNEKLFKETTLAPMDKLTKLFSFGKTTTLYRGIEGDFLEDLVPGDLFTDNGFASCSSDVQVASRFGGEYIFRIKAPKEQTFGFGALHEKEFILPRKTTFHIKKIQRKKLYSKKFSNKRWYTIFDADIVEID